VPVDLKTNEWNLLRDQFRALVHNEGSREDSRAAVDDGIRRRFGEAISRACGRRGKQTFPPSENDYVELAQAHLLRRR
jgi:hypothetical protein